MKTVALVPARSGSCGVPGKNIKSIAGKPLIAWSIEHALSSRLVEEVFVSTDCEDIAQTSRNYGAKVPFLRPAEISSDNSSTETAVEHFCEYLDQKNLNYDNILLIQCTSPIRALDRFDSAIKYFKKGNFDSLISVAESHRFFWRNLNNPTPDYNFLDRPRRQDISLADKSYLETGSFYLFKISKFLQSKNRICGKYGLYITPEEEAMDIDSLVDFFICESLLDFKKIGKKFVE